MSDIHRDIFLGFMRAHLLYHASRRPFFGTEMIEELRHHGYDVSPGTLYPMLHRLEKAGYLKARKCVVVGRVRKYYEATTRGLSVLVELREKVRELTRELTEHQSPPAGPFATPGKVKRKATGKSSGPRSKGGAARSRRGTDTKA